MSAPEKIIGVVVTHKRRELLAESLKVLSTQSRPLDHLVVVDNADEADVKELVDFGRFGAHVEETADGAV